MPHPEKSNRITDISSGNKYSNKDIPSNRDEQFPCKYITQGCLILLIFTGSK